MHSVTKAGRGKLAPACGQLLNRLTFQFALLVIANRLQPVALGIHQQAERQALLAGATGAPDAVHIDLGIARQLEVHHGRQIIDIQAARGDIGGDQHAATELPELDQHLVAIALLHVAVQCQRREYPPGSGSRRRHAPLVWYCKTPRRPRAENAPAASPTPPAVRCFWQTKEALGELLLTVQRLDTDALRRTLEPAAQRLDVLGIGRGKQQGLPAGGGGWR